MSDDTGKLTEDEFIDAAVAILNRRGMNVRRSDMGRVYDEVVAARVAAARAAAWDEGMLTGSSRAMRKMSDEPSLPLASEADNPYRAAALRALGETAEEARGA